MSRHLSEERIDAATIAVEISAENPDDSHGGNYGGGGRSNVPRRRWPPAGSILPRRMNSGEAARSGAAMCFGFLIRRHFPRLVTAQSCVMLARIGDEREVRSWRGKFGEAERPMMTLPELAADALEEFLRSYMRRRFGTSQTPLVEMVPSAARIALECIGNSDALYHNVEHTLLVTLAGHDILRGRALHTHMTADDYAHVIIACLAHDIGYVRGLFRQDDADGFLIDAAGTTVTLPRGSSDAGLMPYHVERSKLYVMQRIDSISPLDKQRIADAIEGTRFPPREGQRYDEEASIVRAADFIGQLGDPNYIRKANALYHEFEEVGMNRQLGYESPADIVNRYPQFYWDMVAPHIQTEIRYLNMTSSGRQWIASLYANVFRAEREISLSGPQN